MSPIRIAYSASDDFAALARLETVRADMVILDLEDGVNASDRLAARKAVVENLLDPQRTILRVNPVDSPDFALDLEVLEPQLEATQLDPLVRGHDTARRDRRLNGQRG